MHLPHSPLQLSVGIENGQLEAYNCDFEQRFSHHIKHVVGVCRVLARRCYTGKARPNEFAFIAPKSTADAEPFMSIVGPQHGFVYLLKDPRDPLLHIHLFEGDSAEEVSAAPMRAFVAGRSIFGFSDYCGVFTKQNGNIYASPNS